MWIKPNRVEKLVLVVPIWHALVIALIFGSIAGFIAGFTSLWALWVWLIFAPLALGTLVIDVMIQRRRGYRHRPGTWSRYKAVRNG